MWRFAEPVLTVFRCVFGSSRDRATSGRTRATNPAQDRYIRWINTSTSTASRIPGLGRISSPNRYQSSTSGWCSSKATSATQRYHAHHLAQWLRLCQEHTMETCSVQNSSFSMNLSCCSEQMDILESIDITMNVMQPAVFRNMIASVMVVSWCGQGFTVMVVLPWWELTERPMSRSARMRYYSITLVH